MWWAGPERGAERFLGQGLGLSEGMFAIRGIVVLCTLSVRYDDPFHDVGLILDVDIRQPHCATFSVASSRNREVLAVVEYMRARTVA